MSVTKEQFDAAQEQLVTDTGVIHQFVTADASTTVDVGNGQTIPSLAKVINDAVGDLDNMVNKDGTGATGLWDIDILGNAETVTSITKAQVEAATGGAVVLAASKGVANGVCDLDANGLVPAVRLPSYVDDVIESATKAALPATGEAGKIYVVIADESRSNTTTQYRWTGSTYARIVSAPGSTDEVAEGTTNKYFTESRVLASILAGFSTASAVAVTAADSVLSAIGKLQAQVTANTAYAKTYDFHGFAAGKPAAAATLLFVKAGRAFTLPANLTGSQFKAKTAATASAAITLYKNGASFATITFAAGAVTATVVATATSFAVGDELTASAPATQDSTLADIAMTLLASQV